jgi:pimeloyl-ACP methyl ester carboxylesterase
LPWLHRLQNPTLVPAGDADPIVPSINARILAHRIPNSELELVPGAGHLLLLEQADTSAATIVKFLDH